MKNKILSGLTIVVFAFSMMAISPMRASANIFSGIGGLGDLFTLDALFNVGDDSNTDLGDLFILDQLFPSEEPAVVVTQSVAEQMSGRILLQVEENGEAWYVNPQDEQRYYLDGPSTAFSVMSGQSVGVSEDDVANYGGVGGTAPQALAGKFIIRPEANGEMHYVSPVDLSISDVIEGPNGAQMLVEKIGLGITNDDLEQIPVAPGSIPVD